MDPANKSKHAVLSAMQEGLRLRRYGLCLGTDANDHSEQPAKRYLRPDHALKNNWHIIGPSGCGKTFTLTWAFDLLTFVPKATLIVLDPKPGGPLYRKTRNRAIARGLARRLKLWDLSEKDPLGYNPLRKNGLSPATQAKAIREAIRSAWGQASFDATPQLFRWLFVALYVARLLELTLIEAIELLRPDSTLRRRVLPRVSDPEAHRSLMYLDAVGLRRIDELTASSIARLEAFTNDPFWRGIVTKDPLASLDLEAIINEGQILLVNFGTYNPHRIDDVKMIARFLINDILAHVFKNGSEERPVFLILDEAHMLLSHDLCAALDMGRECGLRTWISHQFLHQIMDEDTSGYLLHSVLTDARVKLIFGNLPPADLEILTKPIHVKTYTPFWVKDEITMPIFAPVEETRTSTTKARSHSYGEALARPESVSESEADTTTQGMTASTTAGESETASQASTRGKTKGSSLERSMSEMQAEHWSEADTTAQQWADTVGTVETDSEGTSQASAAGASSSSGYDYTFDTDGNFTQSYSSGSGWNSQDISGASSSRSTSTVASHTDGGSMGHASMRGGTTARTVGASLGENTSESESDTTGITKGKSKERGLSASVNRGKTKGKIVTRGVTPSESEEWGESESVTTSAFHAYQERTGVSSRTYGTPEEQALLHIQRAQGQPKAHYLAVTPENRFAYICAPWLTEPKVLPSVLAAGLERVRKAHENAASAAIVINEAVGVPTPSAVPLETQEVMNNEHVTRDPYTNARKPKRTKTTPAS